LHPASHDHSEYCKTESDTGSVSLTVTRPDPAKVVDPVTCDLKTRSKH